jgi:hypothetical protein
MLQKIVANSWIRRTELSKTELIDVISRIMRISCFLLPLLPAALHNILSSKLTKASIHQAQRTFLCFKDACCLPGSCSSDLK